MLHTTQTDTLTFGCSYYDITSDICIVRNWTYNKSVSDVCSEIRWQKNYKDLLRESNVKIIQSCAGNPTYSKSKYFPGKSKKIGIIDVN